MRTQTVIYHEDVTKPITTIDGALMPQVGTKIVVESHGYIVAELPEVYVAQSADRRNAGSVSIYVAVDPE